MLYRALEQSAAPGLPTFAAFTAITAVWLGFYDFVRSRRVLTGAILVTIAATVLLNTASIVSSAMHGRGVPVEQSVFILIFVYVLLIKAQEFQSRQTRGKSEAHEG